MPFNFGSFKLDGFLKNFFFFNFKVKEILSWRKKMRKDIQKQYNGAKSHG